MANSVTDQLLEDLATFYPDFEGSISDKLRAYFLNSDGAATSSYSDLLNLTHSDSADRSGIFPREILEI